MEKFFKVYTYVDGIKDIPFPDLNNQIEISDFSYDVKRMGGAPIISGSILYEKCLDDIWTGKEYVFFNGEYYYLKQIPSSSYSNTDSRYKHELDFVSERIILDNTYFFDVVSNPTDNDKYVSNSSKVDFFGDIQEFATRLNYSLKYSKVAYSVVVDEGISTEAYMMSFEDQFFSQVLQSIFDIYKVPYYFVGKVIHIGYTDNAITKVFKYGVKDSLLSISKTNSNYKIVNRITGVGSAENIPYYYPNPSDNRAEIEAAGGTWILPSANLMPPIYRESKGSERFYNAKNNTYINPETGDYYSFDNQYVDGNPKEHKVSFEDIKPTIKGITNFSGLRIDMFEAFDYDEADNDEKDKEGNYIHPYFFGRLRKFDGINGFNLFDHAIDKGEMTISMTSGNCGACNFIIGVDEDTQKNPVQVHTNGELLRDDKGNVLRSGSPQDIQQDTKNNSVWIALKKDIDTFGVLMPNVANSYRPTAKSDTFVILNIDLPQSYITSAENKLKEEIIKYLSTNNNDKFTFSISFSRIFFAENADILAQLNENARLQIEYNSKLYELYISSYSYKMNSNESLPQITVELADTLTINKGTLQTSIDAVKQDIISSMGGVSGGDILKQGLKYFIRKDVKDYAKFVSFRDGIDVGNFESLLSGGTFRKDIDGKSYIEVDRLYVRLKAIFENLEIKRTTYVGGEQISSPASMKCIKVEDRETIIDPNTKEETVNIWSYYRCFYLSEQDGKKIENEFAVGDQAICKESNISSGSNVANQYYWRLVVGIGDGYIDLDKKDCDTGSTVPMSGDDIVQLGNRTDKTRQQALIQSTVSVDAPSIKFLQGINSYSLEGKAIISQGYDTLNQRAYMKVYGETYIGKQDESSYIKYTPEKGVEIKAKLTTLSGKDIDSEFNTIRDLIDGNIQTWFADPIPTLSNYPANEWITDKEKDNHLGDLYYSKEGKAYRFQKEGDSYVWKLIQDTDITTALAEAKKALDAANNAQTTANEANNNISELNKYIDGAFSDGIITEAEAIAIEKYKNSINETKKNVQASYTKLYNNTYLEGVAKEALKSAYDVLISSIDSLLNKITIAIEDGKTTIQEKNDVDIAYSVFNDKSALYSTAIENANQSIQDKLKSLIDITDNKIAGYEYLKEALNEVTSIQGGLILSSNVSLGQKIGDVISVRSGINGIFNSTKPGNGISYWAGGQMKDIAEDYPLPWQSQNPPKPTNPSLYANSVIRMDGTGYFAGGAMWIDNTGKIYCDPLSFFVGEEQVGQVLTLFTPITTGIYPNKKVVGARQNVPFEDGTGKGRLQIGKYILSEDDKGNLALTRSDGLGANFYTTGGLSCFGLSMDTGGGGGGLIQTVYSYSDINKSFDNTNLTDTFNAYTIGTLASRITTLENSAPKDVVTLSTDQTINGAKIFSKQITSTVAQGIAPFIVSSNTIVNNLNSQYLQGLQSSSFARKDENPYQNLNNLTGSGILSTPVSNEATAERNYPTQEAGTLFYGTSAYNRSNQIYTTYSTMKIFFRGAGDVSYTAWREVAFKDENVASATKLQTSRSIWGQSFDGTGNVSGDLIINNFDIIGYNSKRILASNSSGWVKLNSNGGTLYLGGTDTTDVEVRTGGDYTKAIFKRDGTFNHFGKVSIGNNFSPSITLAIGDSDTGFNWISDGAFRVVSNSVSCIEFNNANIFVERPIQSRVPQGGTPIIVTSTTMCPNLNADLLDGLHGSSYASLIGRNIFDTSGTQPYNFVHLFRIANTSVYSTLSLDIDFRSRYDWGILHIQILCNNPQYGNGGSSIYVYKDARGEFNGNFNFYVKETIQSSGYNYYDIYYSSGAWNPGSFGIVSLSRNGALVYEPKSINLESLPSGCTQVRHSTYLGNSSSATQLQNTRTIWGQSFNGTSNVSGTLNGVADINMSGRVSIGSTLYASGAIELYGGTPYIDFHFNNSSADYTSRIIEDASGRLRVTNKLAVGGYTNDNYSLAVQSFISNEWVRTAGKTGWYNELYEGGIHMEDYTYVKVYNNKRFYSSGGFEINYEGSSWISMATRTNCIIANQNNSSVSAHALFRTTFNNGNVLAYGGLGNEMGFYGFSAYNVANGVNEVTWKARWDSNGNFYNQEKIGTSKIIYAHGEAYTHTWSSVFNPQNSVFGDHIINLVSHNQYKPMLGWRDQLNGQGFITHYNIGSYRTNYSFGQMVLAVGNNDAGTSCGASVNINGNGTVTIEGNLLVTGGITQYSNSISMTDTFSANILRANDCLLVGAGTNKDAPERYICCYGKTGSSYINLGYSGSAANTAEISFNYLGSGSGSNEVGIGFYGGTSYGKLTIRANKNNSLEGSLTTTGTITPGSDMRRKNIIKFTELTVDQVANAPLFDYYWKDLNDGAHTGTSAQYWQNVLPNTVRDNGASGLALDYNGVNIAGLITVSREIVKLKRENEELRQEINKLKERAA